MNWSLILKRTLSFLVIAGIIAGAIWLVYFFFGQNPTLQKIAATVLQTPPAAEQTAPAAQKITAITADPIADYWVNKKTNALYYLNPAGQTLTISGNNETLVNSQPLASLNEVTPSYDGTFAIARFNYPRQPIFSIFTAAGNSWQPLPASTIAATWSPNSDEIAYVDSQGLKILNLDTKKTQSVIALSQKDLELHWRADGKILIASNMGDSVKIMALDMKTKNISLFLEEFGLVMKWAPDDSIGLKLSRAGGASQMSLVDRNGSVLSNLTFVTLPEKCVIFQETEIYCAVPKNIPEGIKLPDDYYQRAAYFDDNFYLIDISGTPSVSELATGSPAPMDAEHLEIFSGKLFFKNRLDGKLYSLAL